MRGAQMDGPGTITWEAFVAYAEELVRLSDEISDHWRFSGDKGSAGQAYLERRVKTYIPSDCLIDRDKEQEEDEWNKSLETCTDPYEMSSANERPLIIEHHVLWSMSYSVPVLYFNGWCADSPGINAVSVEAAQRLTSGDKLAHSELSQAIHPILGRPFLHLHPCGSRELLQMASRSANKLVSWLSAVGPAALGLKLPPDYFKLTMREADES
ncbi:ubiquitin-like-conjugating enzyme ATG10 [Phymastichus coffea]|uniref:ubiquitin-like-conjugating enzyme ATG10 n=1 Tax=Phymastichus coffea TaxID=108790 RepID=UPI00273AA8CA|nr:ubiquitin-like-conjugating enzyme ATG10 [Phymastichus coffea]XP_058806438.1 ubiquitin-like-conjugating enzyme ATG10 [Phymastichus coffea]